MEYLIGRFSFAPTIRKIKYERRFRMRHVNDKESAREIGYLFQALQHEWERSY